MVQQDVYLFRASVEDNIRLWSEDIDDGWFEKARSLRMDGFIRDFPEGYGQMIEERGANLSSGQKQLL